MTQKPLKPLNIFLFIFLTGILTGLFFRVYHSCHHHLSIFYSTQRIEAFVDGECLNTASPIPIGSPHIDVHFEQLLQRSHRGLYLQLFSQMFIRKLDAEHSLFWEYSHHDIPSWAPKRKWGQRFLDSFNIASKGGFSRFHPVNLTTVPAEPFVLETDLVMPTSLRYHFVNPETHQRNIFGADFYAGAYFFALDQEHNNTQRYFINDSMYRNLRSAFLLKVMSSLIIAIVYIPIATLITAGILFIWRHLQGLKILKNSLASIINRFAILGSKLHVLNRFPWWTLIPTCLAAGAAWYLSDSLFMQIPHVNDEGVYLFQAKVFASGRLTIPPPEPVACFQHLGIWWPDRVFSYYTYGHSLLLAFGYFLGVPFLIPILLTAFTTLLTTLVANQIYRSKPTALLGGLLLLCSPLFILLGASYMSHISSMAFNMLFLLYIIRSDTDPSRKNAGIAGFAWGVSFVIRPVTAIIFAIFPVLVWAMRKHSRKTLVWLLLFAIIGGTVGSTAFVHAKLTTGKWPLIQHQVEDRFETGNDQTTFWKNMHQNMAWFLKRSFGWIPYFSLMFAALPFLLFSPNKWNWVFLAGIVFNAWLYSELAHFGWTHEPRYWSEFMPLVALLSAGGLCRLARISIGLHRSTRAAGVTAIIGLISIISLFCVSVTSYWPHELKTYSNYCSIRDKTYKAVLDTEKPNSIFLFHGHPDFLYIPHFYRNSIPDFDGPIIYAMDYDHRSTQDLLHRYPNRSVFIVEDNKPIKQLR